MKKIILIELLILFCSAIYSQQDPQLSLNMFNKMYVNPGYAGANNAICAYAIHRMQWIGFLNKGTPQTTIFSINAPFSFMGYEHGGGLNILSDAAGFEKSIAMNAAYAFRTELGYGKLGIGLSLGFMNKSLKPDPEWIAPDPLANPAITLAMDNAIPSANESATAFDMGFGAFYTMDNLYVGLSTTHLIQSKLSFPSIDKEKASFIKRHFYIMAGYLYQLPNPLFELKPSLHIKTDGPTTQIDLNLIVIYNKQFWGGVSYRIEDAIVAMIGAEFVNGIGFAYAYDITTSMLSKYNSKGSHEFVFKYCFNIVKQKVESSYRSVRY